MATNGRDNPESTSPEAPRGTQASNTSGVAGGLTAPIAIPAVEGGCPTAAAITRTLKSTDLFGRAKTVLIQHGDDHYRLIVTKNGKLLLQK